MQPQFDVTAINDYQLADGRTIPANTRLFAHDGPGGSYYIIWMRCWHLVNADKFSVTND